MIRVNVRRVYKGTYIRWYFNGYHYWEFSEATEKIKTEGEKFATSGKKMFSASSLNLVLDEVTGLRSLMLTKDAQIYQSENWVNIRVLPGTHIVYDDSVNGYEMEIVFEC